MLLSRWRKVTEIDPLIFYNFHHIQNFPVVFKGSFRSGFALWVCDHVVSSVNFTQLFIFLHKPLVCWTSWCLLICLCLPVFHVNGEWIWGWIWFQFGSLAGAPHEWSRSCCPACREVVRSWWCSGWQGPADASDPWSPSRAECDRLPPVTTE